MKITHFILGIAVVLMPSIKLAVQTNDDPLASWDKDVLKQANTAESVSYLSGEEKKLIFYTNLCRLQPKLFCQTVLEDYLKNPPAMVKGSAGLKRTLMADKACGALVPDEDFCKMAKIYVEKMGKEGKEGHLDFEQRMKPFMKKYMRVGENCDYGNELGLDAFMHLLIDQSDPVSLGHRKNLLDINFKAIGVAGAPHKTYRFIYVMDFGG